MAPLSSVTLSDIGELRRGTKSNGFATRSPGKRYEGISEELSSMLDLQTVALSLAVRDQNVFLEREAEARIQKTEWTAEICAGDG